MYDKSADANFQKAESLLVNYLRLTIKISGL
jgi:hypothetical protein